MHFEQYNKLGGIPNIIVDGSANESTVLTLSHWPHSGTPKELKDDLSAEIVFRYLDHPEIHVQAEAVSNNHFDEDGLIGIYCLLNPEEAQKQREFLIDIARVGDFNKYSDRNALHVALTIAAFADKSRSPLNPAVFRGSYPDQAGSLYRHILERLPEIMKNPEQFHSYWESEEAQIATTEKAIESRAIQIEEIKSLDLAIVTLPGSDHPSYSDDPKAACHPTGLYNALHSFCVAIMQGNYYEVQYRYESWVQHQSVRPRARVDMTTLAGHLTNEEKNGAKWEFDGVDDLMPRLYLNGSNESSIAPQRFRELLVNYMHNAPFAWNQYDD
ncbi:MAG TPA: DUF6687 family protein [Candidatus Kapabacteria bacterium]|nr:DUF6687 family protein [Candidatus Kapabacteria bacterium]